MQAAAAIVAVCLAGGSNYLVARRVIRKWYRDPNDDDIPWGTDGNRNRTRLYKYILDEWHTGVPSRLSSTSIEPPYASAIVSYRHVLRSHEILVARSSREVETALQTIELACGGNPPDFLGNSWN